MKYIGILALVTKLVLGDFCYQIGSSFAMNLHQEGTRLQVTTRGNYPWVSFGIPKSPDFVRMNLGNYVVGGGGHVYDMILTVDHNGRPDANGTLDVVPGTESTSTVGGVTTLSFEREVAPGHGYLSVDTSKPFTILWAAGPLTSGSGWQSIGYHMNHAGNFKVDMKSSGNCDAATVAALKAATPTFGSPKGKKGTPPKSTKSTPKKAAPKKAPVCTVGQTLCTSAHQAQGSNCILNTCYTSTTVSVPVCTAGQTLCTSAHQAQGSNCILNTCYTSTTVSVPVCTADQTLCTSALQAQGLNCILHTCVTTTTAVPTTVCASGQSFCSAAMATLYDCIVGACFYVPRVPSATNTVCPNGQTVCTASLQAQGANCIVGACFVGFGGK